LAFAIPPTKRPPESGLCTEAHSSLRESFLAIRMYLTDILLLPPSPLDVPDPMFRV
jgi:hypothetical protein